MPPRLRSSYARLASQLLLFGVSGVLGFVVDAGMLTVLLSLGGGLYFSRLGSFLSAATFTWLFNRWLTFRVVRAPSLREWSSYILANALGGLVNLAIYAGLVARVQMVAAQPVLGVAVGSLAGMLINFAASRLVFQDRRP